MASELARLLGAESAEAVHRSLRDWLNTCPELPAGAEVTFEDLPENTWGICFSTDQAPIYLARYILGGYKAQYQFRLIYRVLPSGDGDILDAVETLTKISAWCASAEPPEIENACSVKLERTSDAAILAAYEDGSNDYGTSLTMTWEVI